MNLLDIAQTAGRNYRKATNAKGGEYHGPCPKCGGSDRFHIWPNQGDHGTFWCRGCDKGGDAIQYLMDYEGMPFPEACKHLGKELPEQEEHRTPRFRSAAAEQFQPRQVEGPQQVWIQHAEKFVTWAHEQLLGNDTQLQWLAARGLDLAAVKKYRLGWNPGEKGRDMYRVREAWGLESVFKEDGTTKKKLWLPIGLTIPYYVDGTLHRVRIRRPEGEPRYYLVPGSGAAPMILGADRKAFVIVEAELDAILVHHLAGDLVGTISQGNSTAKPDEASHRCLEPSLAILVALDSDQAGMQAAVWWKKNYPQADRWPVPVGKDPGEAYKAGVDIRAWVTEGLPPVLTLPPPQKPKPVTRPQIAVSAPGPESPVPASQWFRWETKTGRIIYIADNEEIVRQNRQPGQAWFTTAEMLAMKGMPADEVEGVINAKERIIDVKEIFGGTVAGIFPVEPSTQPAEQRTGGCYWSKQ